MEFESLLPYHQSLIDAFIAKCDTLQSDFSVATLLLWTDFTDPKVCITPEALYICGFVNDEFTFLSPLCEHSYYPTAVDKMEDECIKRGEILNVIYATEHQVQALLKADGSDLDYNSLNFDEQPIFSTPQHRFRYERSMAEYVYYPDTLIELAGQKLQNKKHRLAKFRKEYEGRYSVRPMTDEDVEGIEEMTVNWNRLKGYDYHEELERLLYLIHHREQLCLQIHILIIDGKIVGMTVFQVLVNGVGVVLFEKCDSEHIDGFSELNHYEAECMKSCKVINRQEDLGLEGLRLSKMTFQPCTLVAKFTLTENLDTEIHDLYQSVFGDSDELTSLIFDANQVPYQALDAVNDKLVACGFVRMKQLRVFGEILNAPYLFGIATDDNYRRQGRAERVIRKLLYELYRDKCPIAMLCPANHKLYAYYIRMGFIRFNFETELTADKLYRDDMRLSIGGIDDYAKVTALFNAYNAKFSFTQYRDEADTLQRLREVDSDGGKLVWLLDRESDAYGYLLLDETDKIIEAVINDAQELNSANDAQTSALGESEKAEIVKKLFSDKGLNAAKLLDNGIRVPLNRPLSEIDIDEDDTYEHNMLRIINPIGFMQYIVPKIKLENDLNINMQVLDPMLHNSTFNIKTVGGAVKISYEHDPDGKDCTLNVQDFMRWLLGRIKLPGLPNLLADLTTAFYEEY